MNTKKKQSSKRYATLSSEETLTMLDKMNDGPLTFGRMLWAWRQCEEMTQEAFANRLGVSKQHLCDLEKERKFANPGRAAQYAKILKLPPDLAVQLTLQDFVRREGLDFEVKVA